MSRPGYLFFSFGSPKPFVVFYLERLRTKSFQLRSILVYSAQLKTFLFSKLS